MRDSGVSSAATTKAQLRNVQTFVDQSRQIETMEGLRTLVADVIRELDFDYFALLHHVDFLAPPPGTFQLSTYPLGWIGRQRETGYMARDPVIAACARTTAGFTWDELPKILTFQGVHRQILDAARAEGIGDGFTVPNHVPGEPLGSASFAVKSGRTLPRGSIAAAQSIGAFAFEAGRRIARSDSGIGHIPRLPPLTKRQRDCLILVARGKSDWVVGKLLGISGETVKEHIDAARRRYEVATRHQLLVRALYNSQIAFTEVLH